MVSKYSDHYSKVDPEIRSREIKNALQHLYQAGLLYPVYATAASGLPLNALINEKKFKILFLDIGLVNCATHLSANILLNEDLLLLNRGILAEQLIGQEILAYADPYNLPSLFFWAREQRGSMAEVDYVMQIDKEIIPIEVKAGKPGRLKSLQLFMQEKQSKWGIQISQRPLERQGQVLSVPLYSISELPRLVRDIR